MDKQTNSVWIVIIGIHNVYVQSVVMDVAWKNTVPIVKCCREKSKLSKRKGRKKAKNKT